MMRGANRNVFFVDIFLSRLSLTKRRKHGRCLISRKLSFNSPLLEIISHIKTNIIPIILINHTFKVFLGSILMSWYLFEQKCLTSLTISPGRGYFILISFYHLISSIFWWCNLWMITIHSRICYVYILSSSYIILFNLRSKLDYTNQIFCESYTGPPAPIEPGIV